MEHALGRQTEIFKYPCERRRTRFKESHTLTDVHGVEVFLEAQALQFVIRLVVGEDNLGTNPSLKVAEQCLHPRPWTQRCNRRRPPSALEFAAPAGIGMDSDRISRIGPGPFNAPPEFPQFGEFSNWVQPAPSNRRIRCAHPHMPRGAAGRVQGPVDVPTDDLDRIHVEKLRRGGKDHQCYLVGIMRRTLPLAREFNPRNVADPARNGAMDWTAFNERLDRLLASDWRRVNEGTSFGLSRRLLRLALACAQQKRNSILDFRGKIRAFSRMDIRPNPDIVFFGAEAGWEAAMIQALFGSGGKVLLIDRDLVAYERFRKAPAMVRVRAPRGWKDPWIVLRRDLSRIEYLRQDFFAVERPAGFDVGIDWGLIEHYEDAAKPTVLDLFRGFLKPGGLQISSCPRDCLAVRLFYRAFSDELNWGYRELMTLDELSAHLTRAGYRIEASFTLTAHNVVACRSIP